MQVYWGLDRQIFHCTQMLLRVLDSITKSTGIKQSFQKALWWFPLPCKRYHAEESASQRSPLFWTSIPLSHLNWPFFFFFFTLPPPGSRSVTFDKDLGFMLIHAPYTITSTRHMQWGGTLLLLLLWLLMWYCMHHFAHLRRTLRYLATVDKAKICTRVFVLFKNSMVLSPVYMHLCRTCLRICLHL